MLKSSPYDISSGVKDLMASDDRDEHLSHPSILTLYNGTFPQTTVVLADKAIQDGIIGCISFFYWGCCGL